MAYKVPEEVKTEAEKWAVPLMAGALVGFGAYHLAKTNPELYGVGAGIVVAVLVTKT